MTTEKQGAARVAAHQTSGRENEVRKWQSAVLATFALLMAVALAQITRYQYIGQIGTTVTVPARMDRLTGRVEYLDVAKGWEPVEKLAHPERYEGR